MLIFYYDLYGNPMKYATRGVAGALKQYIRIRWSNPDLHIGKDGKPAKYMSPKGSGVRFYFPQTIRDAFRERKHIDTLIIQEGEKKPKKHVSTALCLSAYKAYTTSGAHRRVLFKIFSILSRLARFAISYFCLIRTGTILVKIYKRGDDIDQRPTQFAKAAIKFKTYVRNPSQQRNLCRCMVPDTSRKRKKNEKGIDDLLAGTLKVRKTCCLPTFRKP